MIFTRSETVIKDLSAYIVNFEDCVSSFDLGLQRLQSVRVSHLSEERIAKKIDALTSVDRRICPIPKEMIVRYVGKVTLLVAEL